MSGYVSTLCLCRYGCVCVCACGCIVYCVWEPGVCYSLYSHTVFHQGPSSSPQTLSIQFHSPGPLSAWARGWMNSNTWEPWEPTLCWNNSRPVSIRALEEDETASGGDVTIIHTHPHFSPPPTPNSLAPGHSDCMHASRSKDKKKDYCGAEKISFIVCFLLLALHVYIKHRYVQKYWKQSTWTPRYKSLFQVTWAILF